MFSMRTIQTLCIYIYHPQTNCSSLQLVEFADQFAHGGTRKDSRCGHEDFIAGSRHADALVAAKGAMTSQGNVGSGHFCRLNFARTITTSNFGKVRFRRPRTKHRNGNAAAAQFLAQRFGERLHKRLARVVNRHIRTRHKSRHGTNVQNAAAPTLNHAGQKKSGQRDERGDVDLDDFQLARQEQFSEHAVQPKAGIVHQHVHGDASPARLLENFACGFRPCQVRRQNVDFNLMFAPKFRRKFIQRRRIARDENEIGFVRCETSGQFKADARRRAGD